MDVKINGKPSFSHLEVTLNPGETFITESGAMASMDKGIDLKAKLNGGIFKALLKKIFGDESLFINEFTNKSTLAQKLIVTTPNPGDLCEYIVDNRPLILQAGAFVAADSTVQINVEWGGIHSMIAKTGLFRLRVTGQGRVWFASYGASIEKEVNGDFIIDNGHIVGFSPSLALKTRMSGGLISTFTSGEGLVAEFKGQGKVFVQSRSEGGMLNWVNPLLP